MKSILTLAVLIGVVAPQANAIEYDAATYGTTAPAGVTFTPTGGALSIKTHVSGIAGLGIDAGTGGEIDVGQSILVTFAEPQVVSYLILAFLYDGPEFGDPQEIAKITAGGSTYRLQAVGSTSATWDGVGSVTNLSPAEEGKDGLWKITNPFGNAAIGSYLLEAEAPAGWTGSNNSDYSLAGFGTGVPDGGSTLALLGLALVGLTGIRRRVF